MTNDVIYGENEICVRRLGVSDVNFNLLCSTTVQTNVNLSAVILFSPVYFMLWKMLILLQLLMMWILLRKNWTFCWFLQFDF